MTDNLGQSQVLPYLVGLSKKGFQFHLISCEKSHKYEKLRKQIENICAEAGIVWHPLPYTKNPPILSTIKDVMSIKKKAIALHRQYNFSLVHCRSYQAAIVGSILKKKYGVHFLFDMRGFWADERVDGGQWNLKNPIYRLVYRYYKRKEKDFLLRADHVISLTAKAKNEMFTWPYMLNIEDNIEVIPCCTDTALFDPGKVNNDVLEEKRGQLGIKPDDFILSYVGGASLWYMVSEMLDFFKILLQKQPNARFLYITTDNTIELKRLILEKRIPLGSVIITGAARNEVPVLLSLSNATLFFIKPTYSKMSSSPTKQGEIMSMGLPLFCNAGIGDTDDIVTKYQAGIIVQSFENRSYELAIEQFIHSSFDSVAIREGAKQYFGLDRGIKSYHTVYKKILEKGEKS